MTNYSGNLMLLKDGTSGTAGTTIACMRETSFQINNGMIDATCKDAAAFRQLLAGGGVKSMSISATGVVTESVTFDNLATRVISGTIMPYGITFGDGDVINGNFQITTFSASGPVNDIQTYDVTLESDSTFTLTTA